jgi:hypothetical protein
MFRTCFVLPLLALGLLVEASLAAPEAPPSDKKDTAISPAPQAPPVIRLAAQAKTAPSRALRYQLLPDPDDLTPANGAIQWLRAGMAARNVGYKWTEKQWAWSATNLPRKEVRAALDQHAAALRLADQAARCDHCRWEWPPLTIQTLGDLPLGDIQRHRELAHLLSVRFWLELDERAFDKALYTLQTGFALARDVGNGHSVIQDLVGIAIEAIMLGHIQEWQQVPGSPNLYWALTTLPCPLINVHASIRYELDTIYRSFPALRELKKPQSADQVRALVEQMLACMGGMPTEEVPGWARKLGAAGLATKYYPDAKKALIAAGRSEREVEAMPSLQVVLIYMMDSYDSARDDVLKWLAVPPWQALEPLAQMEKSLRTDPRFKSNPLLALLMPAITKVHAASVRSQRYVAAARGAEALRLHAAQHGGNPPAKWADITAVPLPIDPVTNKGLDAFYQVKDGKATLLVPPPPGMPPVVGKHYELVIPER